MGNAAILYRNLADLATLTEANEALAMPVSLLQNPHVQKRYRGLDDQVSIYVDLLAISDINTVALLGTTVGDEARFRIYASTSDPTVATGQVLDTGWIDIDSVAVTGGRAGFDPNYKSVVLLTTTILSPRYFRIDIEDLPASYVEAGRLVIGEAVEFTRNFLPGSTRGWRDLSRRQKTEGGQTLIQRRQKVRLFDLDFDSITETQRWDLIEEIDRENGTTDDVLMIEDVDSENLARDAVWGLMEEIPSVGRTAIPDVFTRRFAVEERL